MACQTTMTRAASPAPATGRREGFSLIELLVVIAIISLLAAMLMPSLSRARQLAETAVCSNNLHGMGLAWAMYADSNGGFGIGLWLSKQTDSFACYWSGRERYRFSYVYWIAPRGWSGWGRAVESQYLGSPEILHPPCYKDQSPWSAYAPYWTGTTMTVTSGWVHAVYNLRDDEQGFGQGLRNDLREHKAIACERINIIGPHDARYNVLYTDASVHMTNPIEYAYWWQDIDAETAHRWSLLDGAYGGRPVPAPYGY